MRVSTFFSLLILLVLGFFSFDFYYYRIYKPCTAPLPYTIGFVDPRQNISHEELIVLAKKAEAVWESSTERDIFTPEKKNDILSRISGRSVTINIRYDERQIRRDEISAGERELDTQAQILANEKRSLEIIQNQFTLQKNTYESHIAAWNASRRTSEISFNNLQTERAALESLEHTLNTKIKTYNDHVAEYNKAVNAFNTHSRFEDEAGTTRNRNIIDLYLLDGTENDTLLLAHELGHAIGIDGHATDPKALMYFRLPKNISGVNDSDITLLTAACNW